MLKSIFYGWSRLRIFYQWDCGWVFKKLGLNWWQILVLQLVVGGRKRQQLCKDKREGERLCGALTHMGPSFIKFGQALSVRSDLLGSFAEDLAQLQDNIEGFPFAQVEQTIRHEFGKDWQELFAEIEEKPVGSASVAQVHKGLTHKGDHVAIKILRPGILEQFDKDIRLFYTLVTLLEWIVPDLKKRTNLKGIIAEFQQWTSGELDFRKEAACATELRLNFKGDSRFFVPEVDWKLSSKQVMTMTWIDGVRIDDEQGRRALGIDDDMLLESCADIFFLQAFRDGFFHGDLHPGNIFVDGAGRLCPVDFGIMGRIDHRFRRFLGFTLSSFLSRDYKGLIAAHKEADMLPEHVNEEEFKQALMRIGEPAFQQANQANISIAHLLAGMLGVFREFRIKPKVELLLLDKTMLMAEGVGKKLNPNVNIWYTVMPSMEAWLAREKQKSLFFNKEIKTWKDRLDRFGKMLDDEGRVHLQAENQPAKSTKVERSSIKEMVKKTSDYHPLWWAVVLFAFLAGVWWG